MEKTYDMKPLNADQMKAARDILLMSQKFADDIKQIMIHSHLWHKGFTLKLHVNPTMDIYTQDVQMYRTVEDGDGLYEEEIERVKGIGEGNETWETNPVCTSREFIHLFDAVQSTEGTDAGEERISYLPPDPLLRNHIFGSPFMGSRESVNV